VAAAVDSALSGCDGCDWWSRGGYRLHGDGQQLHNTLWVLAPYTYYVKGVMLMILGRYLTWSPTFRSCPKAAPHATIIGTVGIGGYGFLLMFYMAGVAGVPRRYAVYPAEVIRTVRADVAAVHHGASARPCCI
jgi:heme/copper-type cytochrome/quinol oxidase subunit 1